MTTSFSKRHDTPGDSVGQNETLLNVARGENEPLEYSTERRIQPRNIHTDSLKRESMQEECDLVLRR